MSHWKEKLEVAAFVLLGASFSGVCGYLFIRGLREVLGVGN